MATSNGSIWFEGEPVNERFDVDALGFKYWFEGEVVTLADNVGIDINESTADDLATIVEAIIIDVIFILDVIVEEYAQPVRLVSV